MRSQRIVRGVTVCAAAALVAGVMRVAALGAAGDRSETLVYAVYAGQDTATQVFKTMKSAWRPARRRAEPSAI